MPNNTITREHIDAILAASRWSDAKLGAKTTVVHCVLPNGFEIVESSGCVDPANYNHALGVEVCKRRIVDQVWKLEGYRLQTILHGLRAEITSGGVNHIARVAHEINRAYSEALDDTSQVPWEQAPEWQKQSARKGVQMHLANPNATPEQSHESWMAEKAAAGWTYGPVKDEATKQHPCFRPYAELPIEQRAKDHLFRAVVRALA